ncbi:Lrp/AsnC family transcriptional regulator [Pseudomonas sp. RTC3]|uniref:Lrp/AsnC family transcriptional regulator n=1 Tax=unclassified Pseudomonas TaxID=196821 RepID=UPI002AB39D86|nr:MULTISPECIES: Lrp/AsnC family transcriptional regulator [unclassified Pseudomonas]MEB0060792.1 Lrp/AsnC family transcriptional regulator [Pseudomonas sp. RTC3]MDY7564562.1 Lrp/AsnC family transcriptional regulator [Pseudomonas sp. 5C2]MEB0026033.1 Lrp/AsnC family transcriptional regulator [Pseudomonas sp. MH9.2]MEB0146042.1 Lrp/AsnC family transcriptional regulator [Pseudomonas sp. CCC2.2]MEB0240382.1 Lrp/AsnC family transcriptional regulator [Pseudomonas sp. 5C2]
MDEQRPTSLFRLTEKDKQLLALLQLNAREPTASLARKLGVSRSAVQERINRLEKAGVITGYSVRIDQDKLQQTVNCFTMTSCTNKSYTDVMTALRKMDSVQAVYAVSGESDFIIHVATHTLGELNGELTQINLIKGVAHTSSYIVMETKFNRRLML